MAGVVFDRVFSGGYGSQTISGTPGDDMIYADAAAGAGLSHISTRDEARGEGDVYDGAVRSVGIGQGDGVHFFAAAAALGSGGALGWRLQAGDKLSASWSQAAMDYDHDSILTGAPAIAAATWRGADYLVTAGLGVSLARIGADGAPELLDNANWDWSTGLLNPGALAVWAGQDALRVLAAGGGEGGLSVLRWTAQGLVLESRIEDDAAMALGAAEDLEIVESGGKVFAIAVSPSENNLSVFELDAAGGAPRLRDGRGIGDGESGFDLAGVGAVEAARIGGHTYVFAAAEGRTVTYRLSADGGLTRIASRAGAEDLAHVELDGRHFLFAVDGGAEIEVFEIAANGRLDAFDSLKLETGARAASVSVTALGERAALMVSREDSDGYDLLSFDLEGDDEVHGGAGDDEIRGGAGADRLLGGDGADRLLGEADGDWLDGGADDDLIYGGDGADVLSGGEGDDRLSGGGGADRADGGAGADEIDGGEGADLLSGGDGDDRLIGGAGADRADGGAGRDSIDGGEGGDTLSGGEGDDRLLGGAGGDRVDGGAGRDVIEGGDGRDDLRGDDGDDALAGGEGDDALIGGEGGDRLAGDAGDDRAFGGTGNDVIEGGEGDDDLRGGDGADRLSGGEGGDRLDGGEGGDRLDGGAGDDRGLGGAGDDVIEGGAGEDMLDGGEGGDDLRGGDDADRLYGGAGDDKADGGAGDDRIEGGDGADDLRGGAGDDTLQGDGGKDALTGHAGRDHLSGGGGKDALNGGGGADDLAGGGGKDVLLGGGGRDEIAGGGGRDKLAGGGGKDLLLGGGGGDLLSGGGGRDRLRGEAGNDRLKGGGGADVFIFDARDGRDRIEDFGRGDKLRFEGADWDDLKISDRKAGALIDFGHTHVLLEGIEADTLDMGDFIF